MKSFRLLKIPMLLAGLGAALFLAPSCKAQSEVSPDHFDGTDPWEIAAHKPVTTNNKSAAASSFQAQNRKNGAGASLQLASERGVSKSEPRAMALQDKRKVTARKSEKEK